MLEQERLSSPSRVVLGGGLLGAALLFISQFLNLSSVHIASSQRALGSITAGAEHGWAMIPIAVLAALLAYGFWSVGSRPALLAVGLLGLLALLITLLHDLSYTHRTGLRTVAGHYVLAGNRPGAGFYLELVGAMLLLLTCVSGFLLIGSGSPVRRAAK